ncbi:MAG: hypothetical protein RIQ79_897 [Verrucomicrobiota bacterium]|jgi:hypothetical protein
MKNSSLLALGLCALASPLSRATEASPSPTPVTRYSEVGRKVITVGDHTVTLIRVRPPALAKAPPPPEPRQPTDAEQATADRRAQKAYVVLSFTSTVYLGGKTPVTELRWRDDEGVTEYVAYSNADFRYLSNVGQFETETTVYDWFLPLIDACDLSELPAGQKPPVPSGLNFEPGVTEYLLDARARDAKGQEPVLAGLDSLCAYYQINYDALKVGYEKREADSEARERELREHPPRTPDATLRWWPLDPKSIKR